MGPSEVATSLRVRSGETLLVYEPVECEAVVIMSTTGFGAQRQPDASDLPAIGAVTETPGVTPELTAGPSVEEKPTRPRATRVAEGAILGGVCTGLARHLGWPVMVIRIGFVGLLLVQFLGAIAYGALWLLLPPEPEDSAPGLEAASRNGMRTVGSCRRAAGRDARTPFDRCSNAWATGSP